MKKFLFFFIPLAVSPFFSGAQVGGNFLGKQIQFTSGGDASLDGHCFGNVDTLPTSNGQNVGLRFSDSAMAYHGNLFFKGPIYESSDTFAGAKTFIKGSGDTVASITHGGAFYLKGTCVNTEGCSNTSYDPLSTAGTACYNYANDINKPNASKPGYSRYIGVEGLNMEHIDSAFYDSLTVDLFKYWVIADGLTFVSDAFPGNNYDCGKGHLVFVAIVEHTTFHWYRLDQKDGFWSSRNQPSSFQTPNNIVTNLDASCSNNPEDIDPPCHQNPISNPAEADTSIMNRAGYEPAGFYCTCGANITLGPEAP